MSKATRARGAGAGAVWPAWLAAVAGTSTWIWALARHRVLLYGDATAHLAIARRIVDSATPGLSQIGTVWLPLPHLLMALFVRLPGWWRTGAAGSIVSVAALIVATLLLHRAVNHVYGATAAAWAAVFFCLNPSLLYLSAVPMTESIYLAVFLGLVYACVRQRPWEAGAWGLAASLCRYDGWFVLPFAVLALAAAAPALRVAWARAWRFCLVAGWGPAFWLGFNAWYFGDPLEFARGRYSARQIYVRTLRAGARPYPGDHHLATAALYFGKTVALTCGAPLLWLALFGLLLSRRHITALWLLLLPLFWYLWAMWSGNVPIFVPQYWPHGYYNLRYGVQMLPAAAVFSGIFVAALAGAARRVTLPALRPGLLAGLALLCATPYALMLRAPGPIAYQEAAHNAPGRLASEARLSAALASYRPGDGVLMYFGTYPGALANAGIPLHEVVQESNFLLWQNALQAPQRYAAWVVAEAGGPVGKLVNRAALARYYHPVAAIDGPGQPHLEVYRRND